MSWKTIADCNRCRKQAPNANRTPQGWVEVPVPAPARTSGYAYYHYCGECVIAILRDRITGGRDDGEPEVGFQIFHDGIAVSLRYATIEEAQAEAETRSFNGTVTFKETEG